MRCSRLGSFIICFLYALTQVSARQQPVLCKICDDAVLCGTKMPQSFNCTNELPCSIRQYWLCRQLVQPDMKSNKCDRPGKYPHPESSSLFYNCTIDDDTLQFEARTLRCPLNTTFNTLAARCLTQEEINTLNYIDKSIIFDRNNTEYVCKSSGTHMDENDCKIFHVCNEKLKPQVFSCSRGRYFNGAQCKPNMTKTCVAQLNKISKDQTARFEEIYKSVKSFISEPPKRNCSITLKTSQMIDIIIFNSISASLNNNLTEGLNIENIINEYISNNRDKENANDNYNQKSKIIFLQFAPGNITVDSIAQGVPDASGDGRNATGPQSDVYVYTINGKPLRVPKYNNKSQKHQNIFFHDDVESIDVLDPLDHKEEKSDDPQNNRKPSYVHDELETVDLLDHLEHSHSDTSGEIKSNNSSREESEPKSDGSSQEEPEKHKRPEIPEREDSQNDHHGILSQYGQPIKVGAAENKKHRYPKSEPKIFEHLYFTESSMNEHNTHGSKVNRENKEDRETQVNKESDGKTESKEHKEDRESYNGNKENRESEEFSGNKKIRKSKKHSGNKETKVTKNYDGSEQTTVNENYKDNKQTKVTKNHDGNEQTTVNENYKDNKQTKVTKNHDGNEQTTVNENYKVNKQTNVTKNHDGNEQTTVNENYKDNKQTKVTKNHNGNEQTTVNENYKDNKQTKVTKNHDGNEQTTVNENYKVNKDTKVTENYDGNKQTTVNENYKDNKDTKVTENREGKKKTRESDGNKDNRKSNTNNESYKESLLTTPQENYETTALGTTKGTKENVNKSTTDVTKEIITETSAKSTEESITSKAISQGKKLLPKDNPLSQPVSQLFACKKVGNFPYPNSCTKYYRCRMRGTTLIAIPSVCIHGKYFSELLGICFRRKPKGC